MLDNFHDADGEVVQPYFAAFMIERGYRRSKHIFERDGHGLEYQDWNRARWLEFKVPRGISLHVTSKEDHAAFKEWLELRCIDFACRNSVEGVPLAA
ncbi:hypothetical protein [Paenirhodobacter populi]|uniref:Uncharacterized protein n=1 Tax=Paenirhodobacter populi TaxID=2306993 RepID=A0A443JEB8_9RHOB|nr:hypothetical protein [Sinirhodobacter populi]RWR18820.1 hypothetical protein D2T30_15795 [Sinirhodobacter populi]